MKRILQNKFLQVFWVSLIIYFFSYNVLGLFYTNLNIEFLYFMKSRFQIDTISHENSNSLTTKKVKYINSGSGSNIDNNIERELKVADSRIVVVTIDDETLKRLSYPLDRGDYIPFLNNLIKAKPAVVGFDILFIDKWKDAQKDSKLAQKFKELWNVVIGSDLEETTKKVNGINYQIINKPYVDFLNAVSSVWFFPPNIDSTTNKAISIYPFNKYYYVNKEKHQWKVEYNESFAFSILRNYFNFKKSINDIQSFYKQDKNISDWVYTFFDRRIQVQDGKFYINFIKQSDFYTIPFIDIYTWNFKTSDITNKIVLVWYTAEWVKDEFLLPWVWITKWVFVHANVINNVLKNNYILHFNKYIEVFISFLFIVFLVYLNIYYLKKLNLRWVSWWAVILFVFVITLYSILFKALYENYWIFLVPNYPFEFITVLFLSFFVSAVLKYMNEDKNKKLLSQALSEYVSSDIAREILHSTWEVKLSWENKKITIFFSDIAGFTTISEKMSPEDLVAFLRVYLWEMSNIILDNKWFINKYEWDAIMALWWVFGHVENFWVIEACKSCLLQQSRLKALNEIWKIEWKDQLSVRMGLHTWPAIIWNIGAAGRKMEFTALWDSVNLGSRLEWVNKFYGTNICVSEDIYHEAKDQFTFRYLDKIRVKWKNIWVNIYELISYIGEEWDLKKEIIKKFDMALKLYYNRKFEEALTVFQQWVNLGDNPAKTYVSRCEQYIAHPPKQDWDGIWTLDEK